MQLTYTNREMLRTEFNFVCSLKYIGPLGLCLLKKVVNDALGFFWLACWAFSEIQFLICSAQGLFFVIELSIDELERYSNAVSWIDVCKNWQEQP